MARNKETSELRYAMRLVDFKVRSLIGEFGFTEDDREDLKQDLMLYLLEKWPQFDSERGAATTYIDRILDNKIRSIIRHRRTKKHDYRVQFYSLDKQVKGVDGDVLALEDIISHEDTMISCGRLSRSAFDHCGLEIDLEYALLSLPDDLRTLCEFLKVKSIAEIAKETGEDRNSINHKIRKIRKLLGNSELKNYL